MAQTTVQVQTLHGMSTALGWSGQHAVTIDRTTQAGGQGLGYSGGELLCLAIGACYCNDIYREADKRGMRVTSVHVQVQGDWGGDPVRAQNVSYDVKIEADGSDAEIRDLIAYTDRIAEIPNSLRMATAVTLANVEVVSAARRG